MNRHLEILGAGQIWDLRGILPYAPEKTFEDLFSGRALGQMAQGVIKAKGKISGLSVTRALLSRNKQEKAKARILLEGLAENAAQGIKTLSQGKGFKPAWPTRERNYWRNLDIVIIGGGVSENLTGKILVSAIKSSLSKCGLPGLKVYQAKFPGKEAGFLGAVINILQLICKEGKNQGIKKIAACGLDLGREEIGVGLLAINPNTGKLLKQGRHYWIFRHSAKTPYRNYLKDFLDSRRDYSVSERRLGKRIRQAILKEMSHLIIQAIAQARKLGLETSRNIGVAVPGRPSRDGSIMDSTDYLPFFRKQDGFNFALALKGSLRQSGLPGAGIHIINDGIAAGIANMHFSNLSRGKVAFLGAGSGLGSCVGRIDDDEKK